MKLPIFNPICLVNAIIPAINGDNIPYCKTCNKRLKAPWEAKNDVEKAEIEAILTTHRKLGHEVTYRTKKVMAEFRRQMVLAKNRPLNAQVM